MSCCPRPSRVCCYRVVRSRWRVCAEEKGCRPNLYIPTWGNQCRTFVCLLFRCIVVGREKNCKVMLLRQFPMVPPQGCRPKNKQILPRVQIVGINGINAVRWPGERIEDMPMAKNRCGHWWTLA